METTSPPFVSVQKFNKLLKVREKRALTWVEHLELCTMLPYVGEIACTPPEMYGEI